MSRSSKDRHAGPRPARAPASASRRAGKSRFRLAVEGLEGRALLSAIGTPDPTFADRGEYIVPVQPAGNTGLVNIYAMDIRPDGKVDVAGLSGFADSRTYGVLQLNADGSLDTSFGQAGEAKVAMPPGFFANAKLYAELLQPDGKIVLAGTIADDAGWVESIVARLNPDGSPDAGFGPGGITVLGLDGLELNYAALQPNGKIVVAGDMPVPGATLGNTETAVARLDSSGRLDPSFGGDGLVALTTVPAEQRIATIPTFEKATGVAIAPNGRIVLVGDTSVPQPATPTAPLLTAEVFRLNADGSRDAGFGQSGVRAADLAMSDINGVIVQPDGRVLVLGNAPPSYPNGPPVLARLNEDGSLEGLVPLPHPRNGYVVNAFALQADGKIVVTGDQFNTEFYAIRVDPDLTLDASFGVDGESDFPIYNDVRPKAAAAEVVAIAPDGRIVLGGTSLYSTYLVVARISGGSAADPASGPAGPVADPEVAGDYLGDGMAQPTVYLPNVGAFAIRSAASGDRITPFGVAGSGQTIPSPGDYDGSGKAELAAYLPKLGLFAYRPADGGPDVIEPFGIAGTGQSIPSPGHYDGKGLDDIAVYLPAFGAFAIRSPGHLDRIIPFGLPGQGGTIPAPGDYFGTGRTDIAAYLPSLGAFALRDPADGLDRIIPFGLPGAGNSIPVPGDYDWSGKTELAVYLPNLGEFIYRPADGGPDVIEPFGKLGEGQTLLAPGDYDGSGHDELAAYLPGFGAFAYRPGDRADVVMPFGMGGLGQTVPATIVPEPTTITIPVPPPADPIPPVVAQAGHKKGRKR